MRVLVTGGAGYIGSVITEELLKAGNFVVVYDSLERGHIQAVSPQAVFVCGLTSDRMRLAQTLAAYNIEAVIHMAAFIEVNKSVSDPDIFFQNNVSGSLSVIQAMNDAGVKKIVFSSTAALYGDPQKLPIQEQDLAAPTNPYGASKLMTEEMLRWCAEAFHLTATSLRYFNAAGASELYGEMHDPETHLIPLALRAALQGTPFAIFGTDYPTRDGSAERDYIHVRDLAQAHIVALQRTDLGLKIYNVGIGRGSTIREVIASVERISGQKLRIIESPRRAGDQIATIADSRKIQTELGWKPAFPALDEIIESAWKWLMNHPNGYER